MNEEMVIEDAVQDTKREEMGVITALRYGLTDQGIGMGYAVKILVGDVGLFMPADQVAQMIEQYKIADLNLLVKQPCVVSVEGNIVTFVRLV